MSHLPAASPASVRQTPGCCSCSGTGTTSPDLQCSSSKPSFAGATGMPGSRCHGTSLPSPEAHADRACMNQSTLNCTVQMRHMHPPDHGPCFRSGEARANGTPNTNLCPCCGSGSAMCRRKEWVGCTTELLRGGAFRAPRQEHVLALRRAGRRIGPRRTRLHTFPRLIIGVRRGCSARSARPLPRSRPLRCLGGPGLPRTGGCARAACRRRSMREWGRVAASGGGGGCRRGGPLASGARRPPAGRRRRRVQAQLHEPAQPERQRLVLLPQRALLGSRARHLRSASTGPWVTRPVRRRRARPLRQPSASQPGLLHAACTRVGVG